MPMIFNTLFRAGRFILPAFALCFFVVSCQSAEEKELETQNQLADSISIRLNSPELKAVNEELKKDPGNAALYNKRAQVYMGIKEMEAAVNDARRAIRLDSTNAAYYLTLVDIHFTRNHTREAKDLLESVAKKFPENTEALMKLSELYFLVRQYQNGIDYVNKALKVDEHLARAYYIKGSIYRESGDTARAISSLETAIEQDNNYIDAFHDLGIIYAAKKNPLALEYYNNALRINPSSQELLYARAKLLQDLGKTEQAIAEYENLLAKFKACDMCHYNLGAIYLEIKKDNRKALDYFTKAIVENPNYLEAYFARGYTYSRLNDKASAKADYNMCLKIEPNYEPALDGLNSL